MDFTQEQMEERLQENLVLSDFWTDKLAKTRDAMTLEEERQARSVTTQCSMTAIAWGLALIAERLKPAKGADV